MSTVYKTGNEPWNGYPYTSPTITTQTQWLPPLTQNQITVDPSALQQVLTSHSSSLAMATQQITQLQRELSELRMAVAWLSTNREMTLDDYHKYMQVKTTITEAIGDTTETAPAMR